MKACESFKKKQLMKKLEKKFIKQDKNKQSSFIFVDNPLLSKSSKFKSYISIQEYKETFGDIDEGGDENDLVTGDTIKPIDETFNDFWKGKHIEICPDGED